jgi:hypothetical protein
LTWGEGQSVPSDTAVVDPYGLENSIVGAYAVCDAYYFFGRNAFCLADMLGDMSGMKGTNSGYYTAMEQYSYIATNSYLDEIWNYGYRTIDYSVRTIEHANRLLKDGNMTSGKRADWSEDELKKIHRSMSQAYGLKSLIYFYLTNYFALPYNGNASSLGLILVKDKPIKPNDAVSRATLALTYQLMLDDIDSAKAHNTLAGSAAYPTNLDKKYCINDGAISAIEARVKLYMGNWAGAATAAADALSKSGATLVANDKTKYEGIFRQKSPSVEDIFAIPYTSTTSDGSSSIANLYGYKSLTSTSKTNGYGGAHYKKLTDLYNNFVGASTSVTCKDVRGYMLVASKTSGTPADGTRYTQKFAVSDRIFNLSIIRASEMQLIIAEAQAQQDNLAAAKTALLQIAKRDSAITDVSSLQNKIDAITTNESGGAINTDKDRLLRFISDERCRELYAEGHRWFDLRRRGDIMNRVSGQSLKNVANFGVKDCVMPIPQAEINASGIAQNPGWIANRP